MRCPKCRGGSRVLRTDALADGKRRSRQCVSPSCGIRFSTTERGSDGPEGPGAAHHGRMIAALRDGRGYDREALTAALNTDRRRAQIAREGRALSDDYDMGPDAPSRLSWAELRGMIRSRAG